MKTTSSEFVKIPLEGVADEQLNLVEVVGEVLVSRNHIVSVQFNIQEASLVVTTTTLVGGGKTAYQWEQQKKVSKNTKTGKATLVPDNSFVEKSYDMWQLEPASIIVTDRKSIERIWKEVYPSEPFDGFEKHEQLVNKISELRSAKEKEFEEKMAAEKLGLVKTDGTPLNQETVEKPTILGADGDIANAE